MSDSAPPSVSLSGPLAGRRRRAEWLAVGLVVVAVVAAYHNSFHGPFIFDDLSLLMPNAGPRDLTAALTPPDTSGLAGRPVASLTFAFNRLIGGLNVEGYHVVNVAIHAVAALLLLAIVGRTLRRPSLAERYGAAALPLATTIALLWALHPVQTESVNYLIQRTESLMGLFYFLTLYAFIRGAEAPAARGWWLVAAAAALLGALTKEIIVTAPVLTFLYDRTFLSGTWREAWRRHWPAHLGVALCWIVIVWQLVTVDHGNVGLGHGVSAWHYALTSCRSIMLYVQRSFWPAPLILDYGLGIVAQLRDVWPQAIGVVALVAGTLLALWRWPRVGFLGAWFLVILAPVSSVVPVLGQPTAEHRLYLSLAAVITLVVLGLYSALGRRSLALGAALALVYGGLTIRRNEDYRSAIVMWTDNVAKLPDCARARLNLGSALFGTDQEAALAHYRASALLDPDYAEPHLGLGNYYAKLPDHRREAVAEYQAALRIRPLMADVYVALGNLYFTESGQDAKALGYYRLAVRLSPEVAELHHNFANALLRLPERRAEGIRELQTAVRLKPELAEAHFRLANILAEEPGRAAEAAGEFIETLRLDPGSALCHYNYAVLLARQPEQAAAAIAQYETTLRLEPGSIPARFNLALLLARDPRRIPEARAHFEAILQAEPENHRARRMLERLTAETNRG